MSSEPPGTGDPALEQLLDYRRRLIERLAQQPAEFEAALAALGAAHWHQGRDPQGRSPHRIVTHVRDLERLAFLPRLRRIVAEDHPVLDAYASHHWSESQYRADVPMPQLLADWAQARAELVSLLRPLPAAAWSRTGFHPPSGSRTLQWWAERALSHARDHLGEIRALSPAASPGVTR